MPARGCILGVTIEPRLSRLVMRGSGLLREATDCLMGPNIASEKEPPLTEGADGRIGRGWAECTNIGKRRFRSAPTACLPLQRA